MSTIKSEYIQEAEVEANNVASERVIEELKGHGFPAYMSYAFLQTAKDTETIILSRLPGRVGLDLIEAGYDLKGFHIKAKSCNWGPMGGFICQLPLFNKFGIEKLSNNAKEIGHYLHRLHAFDEFKKPMLARKAQLANDIGNIDQGLTADEKKAEKKVLEKGADEDIRKIMAKFQYKEATTGAWSGENDLEPTRRLPFIALQRRFVSTNITDATHLTDVTDVIEVVRKMRGVKSIISLSDTMIYGVAQNVTDEDDNVNDKPTVKIDFLLKREPDEDIWTIYHGRVLYKKEVSDEGYPNSFTGGVIGELVKKEVKDKYGEFLDDIFELSADMPYAINNQAILTRINEIAHALPATTDRIMFSKVNGIINPFPPFKAENEYYKNAVSGDYDLFAMWPAASINQNELIRQSELTVGKYNRLGGKIFTTYFGYKCNFAIEHVPGLSELNPNKSVEGDILKESADFGNMNSLGHSVSVVLNSYAAKLISEFNEGVYSTSNKGFHSDEGGRPGIMEIEFPIAVYMPQKYMSQALNNPQPAINTKIPAPNVRDAKEFSCGLIKNAEELVLFIRECMENNYRVFMHYRWMIHLLYNTIKPGDREIKLTTLLKERSDDIMKYNKIFDHTSPDNFKDFNVINANRAVIDRKMEVDDAAYYDDLKLLLTRANDNSEFMYQLRDLMLTYAFTSDMPSAARRDELEALMNKYQIQR
jgi:hypothetical protein